MRHFFVYTLLFLVCEAQNASNSTFDKRLELFEYLMKKYPDNGQTTLPATNMTVNVTVSVYNVFGLSEDEVMEMNGWIRVVWKDPKLRWNSSQWSGVDNIIIPGERVWKPDIGISNAKSIECKDFSNRERMNVEARFDGVVSYFGYFLSETPCPIMTKTFPFDEQVCPVIVSSFYSKKSDFHIVMNNATFKNKNLNNVGQWEQKFFVIYDDYIGENYGSESQYQEIHMLVVLGRKPMYHIVLVILPYCMLCFLASIMFIIKDPATRFGVSLTILLSMSVYFMIVSQGAPKSMIMLSVLDKFLLLQMALLVVLTFIVVLGPMVLEEKETRAPDTDPGEQQKQMRTLTIRGVKYRFMNMKKSRWQRRCDFIWLAVYLILSFLNGLVLLFIIPKTSPKYDDQWRKLPELFPQS